MKRRWGNLAAAAGAIVVTLTIAEVVTRAVWDDAPAADVEGDPLPISRVRDPEILYRLVPGSSGFYQGTRVDVNSMGLRDRDYSDRAPAGTKRVLVLGDSMVFGIGLESERTLPARLAEAIQGEAINAGVFGYNLTQQISLLREIAPAYGPDIVVACFVHNDIDNWGLGDNGAVPVIQSSRFDLPPDDAWSTMLAGLMLPEAFDPDILNLLPSDQASGVRGWLARHSRLYMFTYLRLRTHAWNMTSGEHIDPFVDSGTCQAQEVIWEGLRRQYQRLRSITENSGARLVVVIHGGLLWNGAPLARLSEILRQESIPFLDLTPVWGDAAFYAENFTLGWDPHPNGAANELAAGLIADFLARLDKGGDIPDPHAVIAARADLSDRLAEWRSSSVSASNVRQNRDLPRYLYGFWEARPGTVPLPVPDDGVLWMSNTGSILLEKDDGAREVELILWIPPDDALEAVSPREVTVSIGAPPETCGARVMVHRFGPSEDGYHSIRVALPSVVADSEVIEVTLRPDRTFEAMALHAAANPQTVRDARRVSFVVVGAYVR